MKILAHNRLNKIKPSATIAVSTIAASLRDKGEDVISLGAGEPDFDTPSNIKNAAWQAIQDGQTKYTAVSGINQLRKAIQDKFLKDNNLKYDLDQIIVSNGAKQIVYNALMASIEEGDEVIIPAPYWVSYPDMVSLSGGTPVTIQCKENNHFKMTANELENVITKKTKWLILNSPSNPTGALYSKQEIRNIADVILKYPDLWVMTDDMYEHLVFDDKEFNTIADVEPKLYDRILTINGVSKAYAMTGWRIGYAAGKKELIAAMNKIQSQSTSNTCTISQYAALEAISGPKEEVQKMKQQFQQRRNTVVKLLNDIEGITCMLPDGAFYTYPNCSGLINKVTPKGSVLENDKDVAQYLLEEAKVAVVPGEAFGLSPYFRLSYATSLEILEDACHRIKLACEKLKG